MAHLVLMAGVFAASFIIGYTLISRVSPLLHTPLMSMTNAISAVTILGFLLIRIKMIKIRNSRLS